MRKLVPAVLTCLLLILTTVAAPATAGTGGQPRPGATGIGDPYFPTDGNGGYDVAHYDLAIRYFPDTDRLRGVATIRARTTQALSQFNLDLNGLQVSAVQVNGRWARFHQVDDELIITPQRPLAKHARFSVASATPACPRSSTSRPSVMSGSFATDDGAADRRPTARRRYLVPGQRPSARQGQLSLPRSRFRAAWRWSRTAISPASTGRRTPAPGPGSPRTPWRPTSRPRPSVSSDLDTRKVDGIRYWDAIDPSLFEQPEPRTGTQYAISGGDDSAYKRLSRMIRRAGGWRPVVLPGRPGHRTGLGLLLRRGPSGRHGHLDDAAGCERAHRRLDRLQFVLLAGLHPVPHPLPDR